MGHKFNTKDGALHILASFIRTDNRSPTAEGGKRPLASASLWRTPCSLMQRNHPIPDMSISDCHAFQGSYPLISSLSLVEQSIWPRFACCFLEFPTPLVVFVCRLAG